MHATSNLAEIEKLCNEIMNSPYLRKQTPAELMQLRAMLDKVSLLVSHSLPPLISEVKQLRSQNKRLIAEIEALSASNQSAQASLAREPALPG